jgi:hypothetical protein
LKIPSGIPASRAKTAKASAENGVNSEGFKITAQPAAKAAAAFLVIMALGKFQGVIAATIPIGSKVVIIF